MTLKMELITIDYLSRAEIWLLITTLSYFFMNGAQIFETAVLVPKWTASPPETFQFFKGEHAIDLKKFWIIIHSLHEVTFILAIIFCWKLDIRNALLILFVVHTAVRAWTLLYFAPNVIAFQDITNGAAFSADLVKRTELWRNLNYIRVGIFIAVSIGLVPLLIKVVNLKIV